MDPLTPDFRFDGRAWRSKVTRSSLTSASLTFPVQSRINFQSTTRHRGGTFLAFGDERRGVFHPAVGRKACRCALCARAVRMASTRCFQAAYCDSVSSVVSQFGMEPTISATSGSNA